MTNSEKFINQKYLDIKNLVPIDICRIVTNYSLLKEKYYFSPEVGNNSQVENAHSVYADTLMETLLHFLHPHMESITGLKLAPTYSYYRVYRPGMKLDTHRDRPSCEISSTICFGYNYAGKDLDYRWGMFVEPSNLILQNPGDAIIYKGCELTHWREEFNSAAGSYQIQGFFHYIDVNGPFYPEFLFDKRPGIGFKHNLK